MRTRILAGIVVLGSLAGPAIAADIIRAPILTAPARIQLPLAGYLEFYGAHGRSDAYFDPSFDPWLGLGGAGRLNWWMTPNWSSQFDFAGQALTESLEYQYVANTLHGALHLSHRNDQHLLGVFGGVAQTTDYSGEGTDFAWFIGAEGQAYLNRLTLYGQVGHLRQSSGRYGSGSGGGAEYLYHYVFAQAEARFFLTPNTKLAANVGAFHGAPFGSTAETVTTLVWGAEIEHKFGMHPISAFARYEALSYDDDSNSTGSSSTIVGGIKLHFGVGTLLDQDRSGASLKVMQDLTPATWNRVNDQG